MVHSAGAQLYVLLRTRMSASSTRESCCRLRKTRRRTAKEKCGRRRWGKNSDVRGSRQESEAWETGGHRGRGETVARGAASGRLKRPRHPVNAPSDCLRCGACCFSLAERFVRVTGDDWTRLGETAERVAHFLGHRAYMRMIDGHCAALPWSPRLHENDRRPLRRARSAPHR